MNSVLTYVLDASVLLAHGERALAEFRESQVVVPLAALEALATVHSGGAGDRARTVCSLVEGLRARHQDDPGHPLSCPPGVPLDLDDPGSPLIRVVADEGDPRDPIQVRTLRAAATVAIAARSDAGWDESGLGANEDGNTYLVSADPVVRVAAETGWALRSMPFPAAANPQGGFTGVRVVDAPPGMVKALRGGRTVAADVLDVGGDAPNLGLVLRAGGDPANRVLGCLRGGAVHPVEGAAGRRVFGIGAANEEQSLALSFLCCEDPPVVSLGGRAGTGKTLLALCAGLQAVFDGRHKQVVVYRPMEPLGGQRIGFLPGGVDQKMEPWRQAVLGNLERSALFVKHRARIATEGLLDIQPFTFLRGCSVHDRFLVVDEAQNLSLATLLAVLSRVGENSKVVLCWDAAQRDVRLDGRDVTSLVGMLRGSPLFAHVTLVKTERSPVAELAAGCLDELLGG
jgi:PhoH-like ATPase